MFSAVLTALLPSGAVTRGRDSPLEGLATSSVNNCRGRQVSTCDCACVCVRVCVHVCACVCVRVCVLNSPHLHNNGCPLCDTKNDRKWLHLQNWQRDISNITSDSMYPWQQRQPTLVTQPTHSSLPSPGHTTSHHYHKQCCHSPPLLPPASSASR